MVEQKEVCSNATKTIDLLKQEFDPSLLHSRFERQIDGVVNLGLNAGATSGITFIDREGLSKDKIQQEMYPMGYRRVTKRNELEKLTQKYCIGESWLRVFQKDHARFFVHTAPDEGEDNLVIFSVDKENHFVHLRECASRQYVASRVEQNKIRQKVNKVINVIDFSDNKEKNLLLDASVDNQRRRMKNQLRMVSNKIA